MIAGKKVLGIITARGASKGIPGKNIRDFCGKPLIAWTIEVAQKVTGIDKLILSTEDQNIAAVAKEYGCEVPFMRPEHLATDEALSRDVLLHAIEECPGFDWILLLQPTSPLRSAQDIENCLVKSIESNSSCIAGTVPEDNPYHILSEENGTYAPLLGWEGFTKRRQDLPDYVCANGAVFTCSVDSFKEYKTFYQPGLTCVKMPRERSIDIDNEVDWGFAEFLLNKRVKD